MTLSNDLISQFVKVTLDAPKRGVESTVYGTAVEYAGDIYIQLDGSDVMTPASRTATVKPGERVTVKIKDHTATVTGNLTSPSASSTDLNDIGRQVLEIDKIVANTVTVEQLRAELAVVDTLIAEDVIIKGKLQAAEADIVNLRTDKVSTEQLDAVKADIRTLTADVADIDTLMFGSASGNVIQTSFSNAVVAQIGNAQIKSAMIDSIAASKITAGDIITNNIRVMSEDGNLLIADETIQISDGYRSRVQIGKDYGGDYTIYIWDADGNLMFSEGGITEQAVKSPIIRNDMVSETANISASKLDINSLFEEINGSDKTIKSSKIYLDDKNQTLDVTFTQMTSELEGLAGTVTSQGTQLTAIQGKIESKIWQQDINDATGELSTAYSNLSQEVDNFKLEVVDTYATQDSLDTLGARVEITEKDIKSQISETTELGKKVTEVTQTASDLTVQLTNLTFGRRNLLLNTEGTTMNGSFAHFSLSEYGIEAIKNGDVVISFEAKADTNTAMDVYPRYISTTGSETAHTGIRKEFNITTEWAKYSVVFTLSSERDYVRWTIRSNSNVSNWVATNVYVKNIKLELGTEVSEWSPAPEDISAAGKTATNYLNFSGNGLIVGDMTSSTLGKNVLIDSDSVDIRNGTSTLASFGAELIELGKNSESSVISLCGGKGTISVRDAGADDKRLSVTSDYLELYSEYLSSGSYKSASAWVSHNSVSLFANWYDTIEDDNGNPTGEIITRSSSRISVTNDTVDIYTRDHYQLFAGEESGQPSQVIFGNPINFTVGMNQTIQITGANKVLWSGYSQMKGSSTATLSEGITSQMNGIVLVFSTFNPNSGAVDNYNWNEVFIPKQAIQYNNETGHTVFLVNNGLSAIAFKYLYLRNTTIKGNDVNANNGTNNGITYANGWFALRYVIGV